MENIKTTLNQINEGLTVESEAEILPVYYDGQLANGAAFAAYRFRRFAEAAGRSATEAAHNAAHAAVRAAELTGHYLDYMANARP
jgi:hypothetical protein